MFNNLKNKKGERKMKNEKINFVSADNGSLKLHWGDPLMDDTRANFASNDVNALANEIRERGFEDGTFFSSSMDFAKENGFKNNKDAKKLFFKAVELSKTKKTIH